MRPSDQTTIILSGTTLKNNPFSPFKETQSILETKNNSAVIFPKVKIQSWWEIELQSNLTIVVSPLYDREARIQSEFPINVSGVNVQVYFQSVTEKKDIVSKSQFLMLLPAEGKFAEPFITFGHPSICEFSSTSAYYNSFADDPRTAGLSIELICPECDVKAYDFLCLAGLFLPAAFILIYVLYRRQTYSAWALTNRGLAIFMATIVLMGIALEVILYSNVRRAQDNPFCTDDYEPVVWSKTLRHTRFQWRFYLPVADSEFYGSTSSLSASLVKIQNLTRGFAQSRLQTKESIGTSVCGYFYSPYSSSDCGHPCGSFGTKEMAFPPVFLWRLSLAQLWCSWTCGNH